MMSAVTFFQGSQLVVLDSAVRCTPSNVPESSDFLRVVLRYVITIPQSRIRVRNESSIEHESIKDTCNFAFIAAFFFI